MKCSLSDFILPNGISIPSIGFGTADLGDGDVTEIIKMAVRAGYRLIDSASVYGSEKSIGSAVSQLIENGKIERSDLFIQTKLDPEKYGYNATLHKYL